MVLPLDSDVSRGVRGMGLWVDRWKERRRSGKERREILEVNSKRSIVRRRSCWKGPLRSEKGSGGIPGSMCREALPRGSSVVDFRTVRRVREWVSGVCDVPLLNTNRSEPRVWESFYQSRIVRENFLLTRLFLSLHK